MKKGITTIIVALGFCLSVFLTSTAMAGSFGFGVIGNKANFSTTGTEKDDDETNTGKENESVFYGSVFAEYTFGEGHGLTVGAAFTPMNSVIGSGTRTDSGSVGVSDDDGTYEAKANVKNHTTIYIEPTLMYDNFGVYLKGGVARVLVNSLEKINIGTDSSAYGDEWINGLMYGFGITNRFDTGMFYKLEAVRIQYDQVSLVSSTGNKNVITADPDQLAARLAIGWRF